MNWDTYSGWLLLALGFGFVVFWHELGHFLAAKWAGVKVEQFAVGFGQALLAYRKGLGVRVGTTAKEFRKRLEAHLASKQANEAGGQFGAGEKHEPTEMELADAARELGISETEYRLNWIPLGGYVKMLGQDDLRPNAEAVDPRAYNRQPISKRMVIVSAGVVMNVILAAFGFMVLFMMGFRVPPAKVGNVLPGSPAQLAGVQVGDQILKLGGKPQYNDWTKVNLNVALAASGEPIPLEVERVVDGKKQVLTLVARPVKGSGPGRGEFVGLGIEQSLDLKGFDVKDVKAPSEAELKELKEQAARVSPEHHLILPGDVITKVGDTPVTPEDYPVFDRALQQSGGDPVRITVRRATGKEEDLLVKPHFQEPYGTDPVNFGGLVPRLRVTSIAKESNAAGKLLPNDIIVAIAVGPNKDTIHHPTFAEFRDQLNKAGHASTTVDLTVLREGQPNPIKIPDLAPIQLSPDDYGLGIGRPYQEEQAVVAAAVHGSAAEAAGVPRGARVVSVAGQPVSTWDDVFTAMQAAAGRLPSTRPATQTASVSPTGASPAGSASPVVIPITLLNESGQEHKVDLKMSPEQVAGLMRNRYGHPLTGLAGTIKPRKASGFLDAVKQGAVETRDFILQFYVTLRRIVTGDVSYKNVTGPVGIFQAGAGFAARGNDWLLWFLSMISANLAVVNFLPIPIVDGGLFLFLLLEKIKGRPLSAKTQAIAQYVGLAMLLGIVLFVTWQDIIWLPFRGR